MSNQLSPLADRMRPQKLDEFVGQGHLVHEGQVLRTIIENDQIPSMIFWGPPGSGKTTLAQIIAHTTGATFKQLSATLSGVKEIREVVANARERKLTEDTHTIFFIDEIHRFNKSQQDSLLPHVEDGTVTLIGATTENPSFEVNAALLSRSRVFVLKALEPEDLAVVIKQALVDTERGLGNQPIDIGDEEINLIALLANGDARTALNTLELAVNLSKEKENRKTVTKELIKTALQRETLIYDRAGDEHYNTISAFIKSMRAGDADAAIYYLARMIESGEDPKFIARRMVIFASEDIGLAQPTALVVANEVFRTCETIGYPECAINLAHGAAYLAIQKKDRSAYDALRAAQEDVKRFGNLPIPLEVRNAPTQLMKEEGYGKGYEMYPDKSKTLLPEKLKDQKYLRNKNES